MVGEGDRGDTWISARGYNPGRDNGGLDQGGISRDGFSGKMFS